MKQIQLTKEQVALVDDADYKWLNRWKWYARQGRYTFYVTRLIYMTKGKPKIEQMHRLILGLQPSDKRQVDHIDGDGLNNHRSNLRICTRIQNRQSSRKWKIGASRYKGVCWRSDRHKWLSRIRLNKKLIYLGLFDSEIGAALAYNKAASKHFGEYALLNII